MNRKSSIILLILLFVTTVILQGCGSKSSNDVIKIALAGPMTGDNAQFGESMKLGVNMAVDEINARGGVLGKKIQVYYEDDKGTPIEAVNVAQRIAADKDTAAVIGHFLSSCTMAATPIYQKAGIPDIAVASTNPGATAAGNYIFRVNVTNIDQGAGIIKWLKDNNKKRIAIIYANDDYGKGIAEKAIETAKNIGLDVVYKGTVAPTGEKDFMVLLTSAKEVKPDALVIFSFYAVGAQIVLQADKIGLEGIRIGSDAIYAPDFIKIGGKSAEGVMVATWFHPDNKAAGTREFVKAFQAKYNKSADSWAPYAYDAMNIIAKAIEKAGKVDRKAIREALAQTKDFNGATGNITFNADRVPDPSAKKLLFTVVKDGKFQLIE